MDPLATAGSGALKLFETLANGQSAFAAVLFSKRLVQHEERRLRMIGELAQTHPGLRELFGLANQPKLPPSDTSVSNVGGSGPTLNQLAELEETNDLLSTGSTHPLWLRFYHEENQRLDSTGQVLNVALEEISRREEEGQKATEQPVDSTWASRFFDKAKHIRDEDLQVAWGKLLAGEVMSPGSYSPRTIQVLEGMGTSDAQLWSLSVSLSISIMGHLNGLTSRALGFIPNYPDDTNDIISHSDMINLESIGLINSTTSEFRFDRLIRNKNEYIGVLANPYLIKVFISDHTIPSIIVGNMFTNAGRELTGLVTEPTSLERAKKITYVIHKSGYDAVLFGLAAEQVDRDAHPIGPELLSLVHR